MDMDRLVRRVSEQLAERPSRRGFVATLAAGTGAALAGLRGPGVAAAPFKSGPTCCRGDLCDKPNRCNPRSSKKGYSWYCTADEDTGFSPTAPNYGVRYLCQDCVTETNAFVCLTAKQV
jgi:hypothetical protein